MDIGKRKSDECHYCANPKRHDRKRCKLTLADPSELMIPFRGNFKCRGRGGKEIESSADDGIHLKKIFADVTKVNSELNNDYGHQMNFKRKKDYLRSARHKQAQRNFTRSRSSRSDVSRPTSEMRLTGLPKSKVHSGSNLSEMSSPSEIAVGDQCSFIKSPTNLSLLTQSDPSSTDEFSITTCIAQRNDYGRKQDSKTPRVQKKRYTQALALQSRRSRTSSESVHDYLKEVSQQLRKERLLGKLDQVESQPQKSNRPKGCSKSQEPNERKNRSKGLKNVESNSTHPSEHNRQTRVHRVRTVNSGSINQSCLEARTEPAEKSNSFWSRIFHLFSLGCWKSEANNTSPSTHRKSERNDTVSEPDNSSGSESSSSSTGTTTVAACGRFSARTKSDDVRSAGEIPTAKAPSGRSSGSGDNKMMAAKLVESLKRFFSRNPKGDSDQCETTSDKTSEESTSEPSSSAPLHQKQQPQKALGSISRYRHIKSPNSASLKPLLDDRPESLLSTENEISDAEIVDICPMHVQPL